MAHPNRIKALNDILTPNSSSPTKVTTIVSEWDDYFSHRTSSSESFGENLQCRDPVQPHDKNSSSSSPSESQPQDGMLDDAKSNCELDEWEEELDWEDKDEEDEREEVSPFPPTRRILGLSVPFLVSVLVVCFGCSILWLVASLMPYSKFFLFLLVVCILWEVDGLLFGGRRRR